MNAELQRRFVAIEDQRASLQVALLSLSDTQVNWTPNAATWSISQIVQHLVLSDETLGRAQDGGTIKSEALMFRLVPRSWRLALILRALRRDVVLPLPSPAVDPIGVVSLSDLWTRWETARGEMRRALDTLPCDKRRYSHPVVGPLSAAEMLDLGKTHTDYHGRQIEALQRDKAYPRQVEA